jgi:fibronectin-binding autotransporter adhesin
MHKRTGNCRKRRRSHLLIAAAATFTVAPMAHAQTQTITFDDLVDSGGGTQIQNGYAGFDWDNFFVVSSSDAYSLFGPNGYTNGTVSPPNVALNGFGDPASFAPSGGGTFSLDSAYLTAAFVDGLQVTVDGYLNGIIVDSVTFTLNNSGPTLETFDFSNVNSVTFSSSPDSQFAMDDLTVGPAIAGFFWASPTSGSWDVAGNWSTSSTPASVNDVTIAPVNSLTVTGPATPASINSLALGGGGNVTLALQQAGNLTVANALNIYGGGSLVVGGANVTAAALNVDGTLTLCDPGTVSVGGSEIVGNVGTGLLNQSGGTNTISGGNTLYLGYADGSTGTYMLTRGGTLSVSGNEYVGGGGGANGGLNGGGLGIFNQSGGTNAITGGGYLNLGAGIGTTGTYILSGTGAFSIGGPEFIGYYGAGIFNQSGGTNTINDGYTIYIGYTSGATGAYALSGGTLSVSGNEYVGGGGGANGGLNGGGLGIFNQSGGTNTITSGGYLNLGAGIGTTGTYILSGTGAFSIGGPEFIGYYGAGIFNQSGGTNTINDGYTIYIGYTSGATGAYALSGGTLSVSGNEYVGGGGGANGGLNGGGLGIFNQSGGTNAITGGGYLNLGAGIGTTGTYILSGTGAFSIGGPEFIGYYGAGIFNQSGGTNTINDGYTIYIGYTSGATGAYALSGGTLSVSGNEYVGGGGGANGGLNGGGLGIFNQSGGTNTITSGGYLNLGAGIGTTGTYTLSGNGSLSVSGPEYVGYYGSGIFNQSVGSNSCTELELAVNAGATGVVNVSGGTLTIPSSGTLTVYNTPGSGLTLSGGTISTGQLDFNGAPSLFNWTGGTLDLTNSVSFDPAAGPTTTGDAFGASLALEGTQTLNITGDETIAGAGSFILTVGGGGANNISGSLYVGNNDSGNSAGATGTFTLSGAGLLSVAGSEYVGNYGTAAFIQAGGQNTLGGDLRIGNNESGSYALQGGTLAVGGAIYVGSNVTSSLGSTFDQIGGAFSASGVQIGAPTLVNFGYSGEQFHNTYNEYSVDLDYEVGVIVTFVASNGTVSNNVAVDSGNATINGDFSAASIVVGTQPETYHYPTVELAGGPYGPGVYENYEYAAVPGSVGTLAIAGGTTTCSSLLINNGSMNINGTVDAATVSVGSQSTTGASGSSFGVPYSYVTLLSPGTLTVSGNGLLNLVSMGTLTVSNVAGSGITLSGGTINTAALDVNGVPSLFNWTSGTLNLANSVAFDPAAGPTTTGAAFGSSLTLGNNQTLNITGNETIGGAGIFTLTVNGGTNTAGTVNLTASGSYSVTGGYLGCGLFNQAGGSASFVNLNLDAADVGAYNQSGGNNNINGALFLGNTFGSTGTYTLSGGSLATANYEFVGYGGTGIFNQTGGTNTLVKNNFFAGFSAGSVGTYDLGGAGYLAVEQSEILGYQGTGNFNQTGGTNAISGDFDLGYSPGSTGTYVLSGTGSLSVSGSENVGQSSYAPGNFNQSGGANTAESLYISNLPSTYSLGGGTLLVPGGEIIAGGAGTAGFAQTGGMNTTQSVYLGNGGGAAGIYTLGDTGVLEVLPLISNPSGEEIGWNGGIGIFNQSGGTNIVAPGLAVVLGNNAGGTGIYVLSGSGTLSAGGNEYVGVVGAGVFNQSGGVNAIGGELDIAAYNDAYGDIPNGTYLLSGGSMAVNGGVYIGGAGPLGRYGPGPGGTGVLTVSNTGQLFVTGTMTVYNSGRVNINGGSATVGGLAISGGGVVNVNAALAINYGSPGNDPIALIVSYLQTGYAGGAWTGTSTLMGVITSTTAAAGYAANSVPVLSVGYSDGDTDTGAGNSSQTPATAGQILIMMTLAGDALLTGTVNFNDLDIIGRHLNTTGNDWADGNFNYDPNGVVNFNDLDIIGQNLNKTINNAAAELGGTTIPLGAAANVQNTIVIPEPSVMALAAFSAAGLLARRRRRKSTCRPFSDIFPKP